MIKSNKKYHFNMGYDRLIIPGAPSILLGSECREIIKADVERCRRRFGTAVAHYSEVSGNIYIDVTARRDPRSALWGRWFLKPY